MINIFLIMIELNSLQDFLRIGSLNPLACQQIMKALRISIKISIPINYFVEVYQSTGFDV